MSEQLQVTPVIGIEIHVQLATATKMFCSCRNQFGDEPNSNVCPVCMGMPGVLPVMNRQAYEWAVMTALALNCKIAPFTKWDRKNYYYPDLPKNYQISQYDMPLSYDGYLEIPDEGGYRRIRIRRLHLEEDAGKLLHELEGSSQVDLNRAGTPLMEIVSEPDIRSAAQAVTYGQEIRRICLYLGVSEGNMQKGHMRFEPNINLHIKRGGELIETPICEIKNLNSFRALQRSIDYEIDRQLRQWQQDNSYTLQNRGKENRGWDDQAGQTIFQRGKEEAHDYRYFPEPDLVPVTATEQWLERLRAALPELPAQLRKRFTQQYKLSARDAEDLIAEKRDVDFFLAVVAAGASGQRVGKLLLNHGRRLAAERNCLMDELPIEPARWAELARMLDAGRVSATAAAEIIELMMESPDRPEQIAQQRNLIQSSDTEQIRQLLEQVLLANPKAVADARENPKKAKKARGFLLGQVMQKTKGTANPRIVGELLDEYLARPQ